MDERKEPIEESTPSLSPDPQEQNTPMTDAELDRLANDTFCAAFDGISRETHRLSNYTEQLRASVSEIRESLQKIDTFCASDTIKEWEKVFSGVRDCFDHSHLGVNYVAQCIDRVNALLPALEVVIAAYKRAKGLSEVSLEDFLGQTGVIPNEDFTEIIRKSREELHMSPTKEDEAAEAERAGLRSTGGRTVKMLEYPVDKVNNVVWNLLEENTHGQMVLNLKAEPNGQEHKRVDITYSIDFDNIESDLPIVKRLTPFDKRVYIAVGALWSAGNDTVSVEQIYHAMGYDGKINDAIRKKIDTSMTKFHAVVTINNEQELTAGYKYPPAGVDGPLLPFYRGREYKNGQLTAVYVITLYVEGKRVNKIPLIEFAAGRGQVTQLPRKVLQTPLSKTDENLRIEDYCIERIARHKKEGKKILLSTLYSKCGITNRKQKERAPEKIRRLFDYYVQCGEIGGYTLTADAIVFDMPRPDLPKKEK